MIVNCAPAKCLCLPDIDRQKRLCARGAGGGARRLSRGAVFVLCRSCDYRGWLVHFGLARFLAAIPTENAENEAGGAAFVSFCAGALAL